MDTQPIRQSTEGFVGPGDKYPNVEDVLALLQHDEEIQSRTVERIEVNIQASGEFTCRVWEPRAQEPEGVYYEGV